MTQRSTLLKRLKSLEAQIEAVTERPTLFLSGLTLPLPSDYSGELHVVAINQEPPHGLVRRCDFEERPGPAPAGTVGLVGSEYRSTMPNGQQGWCKSAHDEFSQTVSSKRRGSRRPPCHIIVTCDST